MDVVNEDVTDDVTFQNPDDGTLKRILGEAQAIAVVGLSSKEHRDSNSVARFLKERGYRIIPINPAEEQVLGEKAYPSLADVPDPIDLVDVFRRPEHTPEVAREAVAAGAKVLWLQEGIANDEAHAVAAEGGLAVVMDRCIKKELRRLEGEA
jgi:uncharacterized protein